MLLTRNIKLQTAPEPSLNILMLQQFKFHNHKIADLLLKCVAKETDASVLVGEDGEQLQANLKYSFSFTLEFILNSEAVTK